MFVCMSSRFPTVQHLDFCYKPVRISKNGIVMYVPCGKCNGCLLQKANTWSFRLGDEIENAPAGAIFFTPTYNNHYVPKLQCRVEDGQFHYFSAPENIRYNGRFDVPREFMDFYSRYPIYAPLKNYHDPKVFGYLCKTDLQLYFKLLRKSIYEHLFISSGSFRYYVVGEYGPGKNPNQGKYRPHYHCIIFPCNPQVSDFLLDGALYESWQMCDKVRFNDNVKCCDSGARHYVTEYVTGITSLPNLLQEAKEIKPFFLSSKKDGSMGSCQFDRKKVLQDIERGVDKYSKRVSRIDRNYIFRYPSQVTNSLLPKCSRYSLLDFNGLLRIYEYLYNVRKFGFADASLFDEFSKPSVEISQQDYVASLACLKCCDLMNWTPFHYVEVLASFYYRKAQEALRFMYEWQSQHIDSPYLCVGYYFNWSQYLSDGCFDCERFPLRASRYFDSRCWFLSSFGLTWPVDKLKVYQAIDNSLYRDEVDDIIENADKSKKVNALVGQSPHIV